MDPSIEETEGLPENRAFAPARSPGNAWIFIVAFLFFPAMGIFMVAEGIPVIGSAVIVCGLALEGYLIAAAYAVRFGYTVTGDNVQLQDLTSKRVLPLTKIASVTFLTPDEATTFLKERYHAVMKAESGLDLPAWFSSSVRYGNLIRYASVPLITSDTRKGGPFSITGFGVHGAGEAVLLRTMEDEYLLTTPVDCTDFKKALMDAGIPNAVVAELPEQDTGALAHQADSARRLRKTLLTSVITAVALTLGVACYTWYTGRDPRPAIREKVTDAARPIVTAGYWETESRFIFISLRFDTALLPAAGSLVQGRSDEALQGMVQAYTNNNGGNPNDFAGTTAAQNLNSYLQGFSQNRFVKTQRRENDEEYVIYSTEGNGIRNYVEQELKKFYAPAE